MNQPALFELQPPKPPEPTPHWGVEANEINIYTYGVTTHDARQRWTLWRSRMDHTDRITVLNAIPIPGELIHIACDDRDAAQQVMAMFIGWGINPSALKVARLRKPTSLKE